MSFIDNSAGGKLLGRWARSFAGFTRSESGTVTIESVIILPIILFALQATFAYFESFRQKSVALKANYAVADYLSRIPEYDQNTLNGLDDLFEYMTKSEESSWLRVTVVECVARPTRCNDETPRRIRVARQGDPIVLNSHASDGKSGHRNASLRNKMAVHIPPLYRGEAVIMVETWTQYEPTFAGRWTGIYQPEFYHVTVTSPREHDTLCWQDADEC